MEPPDADDTTKDMKTVDDLELPEELLLARTYPGEIVIWAWWIGIALATAGILWLMLRSYTTPIGTNDHGIIVYGPRHLLPGWIAIPTILFAVFVGYLKYLEWRSIVYNVTTFRVNRIANYPGLLFWITDSGDQSELEKVDNVGHRINPLQKVVNWISRWFGADPVGNVIVDAPGTKDTALNNMKWVKNPKQFEESVMSAKQGRTADHAPKIASQEPRRSRRKNRKQ